MSRPAIVERLLANEVSMSASPNEMAQLRAYIEALERDAARYAKARVLLSFSDVDSLIDFANAHEPGERENRRTDAAIDASSPAPGQGVGRG